jgi:hypothetical protein
MPRLIAEGGMWIEAQQEIDATGSRPVTYRRRDARQAADASHPARRLFQVVYVVAAKPPISCDEQVVVAGYQAECNALTVPRRLSTPWLARELPGDAILDVKD